MDKKKDETPELFFEVDKETEGGTYCNMANVVHNKNEFLIDFAISLPGKKAARVQSRIISSPIHVKQLLLALQNNIAKYEELFGPIEIESLPKVSEKTRVIH